MNSASYTFGKHERLRSRQDFGRLKSEGVKVSSAHFVVVRADSRYAHTRFGVTVSRKVGNAVARNRVKRKLREFFRRHKFLFAAADYNVIARQQAAQLESTAMYRELERLMSRFRI